MKLFPLSNPEEYKKIFSCSDPKTSQTQIKYLDINHIWDDGTTKIPCQRSYYRRNKTRSKDGSYIMVDYITDGDTSLIFHLKSRDQYWDYNIDYVKWLLENGALPNIKDGNGKIAMDYCYNYRIGQLIQQYGGFKSKTTDTKLAFRPVFGTKGNATIAYHNLLDQQLMANPVMSKSEYCYMMCIFRAWIWSKKQVQTNMFNPAHKSVLELVQILTRIPAYSLRQVMKFI